LGGGLFKPVFSLGHLKNDRGMCVVLKYFNTVFFKKQAFLGGKIEFIFSFFRA